MMARQRHQRLVIDESEHAGKLARHRAKRDQPPPSIALVNGPSVAEAPLTTKDQARSKWYADVTSDTNDVADPKNKLRVAPKALRSKKP
jgi:hypothetical protein